MNTTPTIAVLILSTATSALAADTPPSIRVIGQQVYTVDQRGNTTGTIRELSPGNWHVLDQKGMTVRTIQTPPGCQPFLPCQGR
ncbi:hypothetical protein [Paramagnetospirillum magnetotacticum]|nr:hypothetical protein [Paramagnetospirillum magnetotacticum]